MNVNLNFQEITNKVVNGVKFGAEKVSNWTHSAKNWTVQHKSEILKAIAIFGALMSVAGLWMFTSGAIGANLFNVDYTSGFLWNWLATGSSIKEVGSVGVSVSSKLIQATSLFLGGLFVSNRARTELKNIEPQAVVA